MAAVCGRSQGLQKYLTIIERGWAKYHDLSGGEYYLPKPKAVANNNKTLQIMIFCNNGVQTIIYLGSYLQDTWWAFGPMKSKKRQHRIIMSVILFLIKISFNGWGFAYQQVNKSWVQRIMLKS